ncbi:MAG: nitroreductase family protein [Oscillospiraceae bacterium]|jgi:nitroreductase
METRNCIETRRSVRKYTDKPVAKALVEDIVRQAQFAPTWKNAQTTRFSAVMDSAVREQLRAALPDFNQNSTKNAPVYIVASAVTHRAGFERDGSASTPLGEGYTFFDCGATVQTLCLAAYDAGLATLVMGLFDTERLRSLLSIPENEVPVVVVALGYPDDAPQAPKRRALDEVLRVF